MFPNKSLWGRVFAGKLSQRQAANVIGQAVYDIVLIAKAYISTFTTGSNLTHLMGYIPSRPSLGPFSALVQFFYWYFRGNYLGLTKPMESSLGKSHGFLLLPPNSHFLLSTILHNWKLVDFINLAQKRVSRFSILFPSLYKFYVQILAVQFHSRNRTDCFFFFFLFPFC